MVDARAALLFNTAVFLAGDAALLAEHGRTALWSLSFGRCRRTMEAEEAGGLLSG
jgi:hypothetical protein